VADEVIAGRYRLEQLVGGGMSEVWSAMDTDLGRRVAVKLLGPNADPARFEREARAAAALAHPNICVLYAYGETHGRSFMVLEYLPGGSLEERLAPGRPLPDAEAHRIAVEIAAGLAHAHARGLVHRDLKPANVLFDGEGRAKIADFGIARMEGEAGLTAAGTVLGTAAYISPEQAAGEPATAASDVYAFGVILFRMLTGRLPFESEDALAVAAMHRDRTPPPVASFRPDAPRRLESVTTAALAKSPADRPQDGAALLTELGGPARPTGDETAVTQILRPERERSRTALVVLAAAALAAAGVGLAMAVTFRGGKKSTPTSTSLPTTLATHSTPVAPPPSTTAATTTAAIAPTTTAPATTTEPTLPTTAFPATTASPTAATPPTTTAPPPPPTTTAPPPTTAPPTTTTETTTTTTTAPTTTPTQPG
jgi:eukaryotic-like serine/threonine-protein kinase